MRRRIEEVVPPKVTMSCIVQFQCRHTMGKGFVRGAYTCVCNEGYSYPVEINPPFQGESLEQATQAEYDAGFSCHPTDCKFGSSCDYFFFNDIIR